MQIRMTFARGSTQTGSNPFHGRAAMPTSTVIDLIFVALVFAGVLYWIFVSPKRARKQRHYEMYGQTGHFKAWDPGIDARKRER